MKTTLKITAAAIALGLGVTALASAQHGPGRHGGAARGMAMLEAADLNGDNTVTRAEIETLEAEEFAWRDRNGDGFLDQADASPTMRRMQELRQERRAEAGMDGDRREGRRGRHHRRGERLDGLDANDDGRISRAEFTGRGRPLFDRLDTNGDDALTPDELDAALERRQAHREARFWWRD